MAGVQQRASRIVGAGEEGEVTMFTERQLRILRQALYIGAKDGSLIGFGEAWEIDSLAADLHDLLQFELERKRERRKSLAIEKRCATLRR